MHAPTTFAFHAETAQRRKLGTLRLKKAATNMSPRHKEKVANMAHRQVDDMREKARMSEEMKVSAPVLVVRGVGAAWVHWSATTLGVGSVLAMART